MAHYFKVLYFLAKWKNILPTTKGTELKKTAGGLNDEIIEVSDEDKFKVGKPWQSCKPTSMTTNSKTKVLPVVKKRNCEKLVSDTATITCRRKTSGKFCTDLSKIEIGSETNGSKRGRNGKDSGRAEDVTKICEISDDEDKIEVVQPRRSRKPKSMMTNSKSEVLPADKKENDVKLISVTTSSIRKTSVHLLTNLPEIETAFKTISSKRGRIEKDSGQDEDITMICEISDDEDKIEVVQPRRGCKPKSMTTNSQSEVLPVDEKEDDEKLISVTASSIEKTSVSLLTNLPKIKTVFKTTGSKRGRNEIDSDQAEDITKICEISDDEHKIEVVQPRRGCKPKSITTNLKSEVLPVDEKENDEKLISDTASSIRKTSVSLVTNLSKIETVFKITGSKRGRNEIDSGRAEDIKKICSNDEESPKGKRDEIIIEKNESDASLSKSYEQECGDLTKPSKHIIPKVKKQKVTKKKKPTVSTRSKNSVYKNKQFLMAKTDLGLSENKKPLYQVSNFLYQKFEPFTENGQILFRRTTAYTYPIPSSYIAIQVKVIRHSVSEMVVQLIKE